MLGMPGEEHVTAETFRELALSLQGVEERAHMGHPDFRVNGRIFASLTADETRATLRLQPQEQAELLSEAPGAFAPAAGAWGRQGWTTVRLAESDARSLRGALVLAWEAATAAPPPRPRRRSAPRH